MLKKSKNTFLSLIFLFGIFSLLIIGCAGNKPKSQADEGGFQTGKSVDEAEASKVEESKQAAESAEWEAHRLREELNRKKQPSQ